MRCKTPDITSKHSQETHYNYVKNSGFCISTSTGKERDSETGFSYFGARYYDSDILTGWLSVDPMADKYPGHSPYQYCRWNPIKRIDVGGLFDTEKQAQKAYEKAVKRFGSDRVGEIYNRGTEKDPDYSFAVYGVGKDNKTHAKQGEAGVWAYRPDCIISNRKSLRSYSWSQRKFGFSVSFSVGAQVGSGISLGKNWGCTANLSSVDLFSHASEYSKVKGWEHNTYTIDNSDIHGNAGVGISAYGYEVGYNCSYTACGEAINQDSMVHSVNIGYAESSSNGRISLEIGAAIIFGVKIELYSEYAK